MRSFPFRLLSVILLIGAMALPGRAQTTAISALPEATSGANQDAIVLYVKSGATFSAKRMVISNAKTMLAPDLSGYVPSTRTVNGSALTGNITITTITGNAGTATTLATPRTINGVSFDGSGNITVTAAAGTLTGSTLASNVTASSLTSAAGGAFGTNAFNSTAFLSANQTITLSGDVTGSGTTAIPVVIGTGKVTDTMLAGSISDVKISSAATWSAKLGVGAIGVTVQGYDADLDTWAGLTPTANAQSLVTAANYAAMRALLGLVIGTNVQAYDADLTTWATISPSANVQSFLASSDYAAMRSALGSTEAIQIACSDLVTPISAGEGKAVFRMPYAALLTAVRASVVGAPAGSTIIINIKEEGTTVLSTKLTIDAGEKTSVSAAVPAVISDAALADDAEITIDFDQVGSSTPGSGVVVTLYITKS